jgi:multiple sugar transport system permease protein
MSESSILNSPVNRNNPSRDMRARFFGPGSFKYWSVAPLIIVLFIFTVLPIFQLLQNSVSTLTFVEGELVTEYVGLGHFDDLAKDPLVGIAIKNTLVYVVTVVIIETFTGFALAVAISRTKTLSVLYRSVVIIPLLIPPVAIGTMWSLMYDYNYGLFTTVLISLGVTNPPLWTADPDLALISVVIVDVWHWTSFMFLIMLAGVESIPPSLLEAARVDGANERTIIRRVILPMMAPTILVAMLLRTILAFKVFDQIFVLTSGGPGTATQVISMHIYKVFSEQFRLGYASFLSLLVAAIMTIFVVFYLWANDVIRRNLT